MFKDKNWKILTGLLVGGLMLVAIACSSDDADDSSSASAPAPTAAAAAPAATAAPAPTTAPAKDDDHDHDGDMIHAPDPTTPAGVAVIATNGVINDENGLNSAQSGDNMKNVGLTETLFARAEDDSTVMWLAESFVVSDDLSSATVKIKSGVSWQDHHGDFGNVTAEDVAWSMNNANSATNPESIHGQAGDFAGLWGEWTAVDDSTVTFEFTNYDSTWKDDYANASGQAFSVFSKKAYDEKGESFVRDNIIGSGVYQVDEWISGESYTMKARPNHHMFTAKTDTIQIIGVKEATTRAALLRTGEVDMAHLEPKDAAKFDMDEFTQTSTSAAVQLGVFFAGNLWEDTYAGGELKGQPLPTKATFVHDLAWIGTTGERASNHDKNVDDGVSDADQAKAVRRAMAMAIDRDLVNEQLLSGLGSPVHVEYFSATHPNWDSKYEYPYDPDAAIALIKAQDADWVTGSGDKSGVLGDHAFEASVYAGPELGGGASITGEVADAVAGFWSDIGISTFSLKFSYQTFRPTVVGRSNTHPWITSCDKGRESNPWHFPKGLVQTTLTRGGFSCGFESPVILDLYNQMAKAPDSAAATAAANEYLAYVYDQSLQPGVVAVPDAYYFNNKKIKSAPMDKAAAASINSLWNLELK